MWLEEYLKNYTRILVLISHSQVHSCSPRALRAHLVIGLPEWRVHEHHSPQGPPAHVLRCRLLSHPPCSLMGLGGNYDRYVQTRMEKEENQMKRYKKEQDEVAHMKEFIARYAAA